MTITETLCYLFERDLKRFRSEITAYEQETDLWKLVGNINNSPGNLCLHLIGNLNHFIGATLGNSGYVRKRDKEFSDQNVPRAEMLLELDKVSSMIPLVLHQISEEDLHKPYPLDFSSKKGEFTTFAFLLHLSTHLNYHLGQVNYHRRQLG